jgi:hypothetical protein
MNKTCRYLEATRPSNHQVWCVQETIYESQSNSDQILKIPLIKLVLDEAKRRDSPMNYCI